MNAVKKRRPEFTFPVVFVFMTFFIAGCDSGGDGSTGPPADDTLAAIRNRIKDAGAEWVAENTSVSSLPEDRRKLRCGTVISDVPRNLKTESAKPLSGALPARFDWRDHDAVSPVKDQGDCAADWAFAPVAALESLLRINERNDLSEQIVLSCAGDCSGGSVENANAFLSETGTNNEDCAPYSGDGVSCEAARSNCGGPPVRIGGTGVVAASVEAIKTAVYENGPVVTIMPVFTDFFYYHSGIYSTVWGDPAGHLAVLVTGWDDAERFFIVKNSWGVGWGESGFFRISYDETEKERFGLKTYSYQPYQPLNIRPYADAGDDITVTAGAYTTLDGSRSYDKETHIESYSWTQTDGPVVRLSDPESISPAFTAPSDMETEATITFQLTVTDSQSLSASDTCAVTVSPIEKKPPAADAGKDRHVIEQDSVTLNGSGESASEDGALSFQWIQTQGIQVSLSDPASQTPSFIAPDVDQFAVKLVFELEVKDSEGLAASDSVNVVVHPNQPPEVKVGLDQYVEGGDRVILEGSAGDQEERFEYEWTQTGGVRVNLLDRETLTPYFIAPSVSGDGTVLTFRLEATDHLGLTDTAATNVIINRMEIDANRSMCPSDCKLIMSVCACPEACEFRTGWVIGVELRILTPGVYWAEDPNIPAFENAGADCRQGGYELEFSRYPDYAKACSSTGHTNKFIVSYYDARDRLVEGPGFQASNRAKIVRTPSPYDGYEITDEDVQKQYCDLWIDMPAMKAVSGEINPGSPLVVRASLSASPPLDQTESDSTGNGTCRWKWDHSFCSDCTGDCYCDKLLGPICCSN